jgi:subtilisin family serine protease
MRPRSQRWFGRCGTAIAAALVVAAVGFASVGDSLAQNYQKKDRAQKNAAPPVKGQVQQRRNAMPNGMAPNRGGFRGQALGPNGVPNAGGPNAANPRANTFSKGGPNAGTQGQNQSQNPNAKGVNTPGTRFGNAQGNANQPGARGFGSNQGGGLGNRQFGLRQGGFGNRQSNFANRQGAFGSRRSPFASRQGFGNNRFGGRGFTNRDPRLRAVNGATPQLRQVQRFTHRTEMFAARARIPLIPLPGERNFTGVPPVGETRFVRTELVCQFGPDVTPEAIAETARRHNLTIMATQRSALTGATLVQFAIGGNRSTADVVRAMEAERIVSQPNYLYLLGQSAAAPASPEPAAAQSGASNDHQQYVANKLRLAEVHKIATGKGVTVAVIDSEIDRAHPELAKSIAERFDAVGKPDEPHLHGTGMAGAIVSQDRLIGVAPGARTLAVHAFSTGATQQSPQATTQSIVAGIEWALSKGARIINMSFAGPQDPFLAQHLKKASEKGAILIAAVGNAGPKSPPLYPAADPRVIGVTAIDEKDQLYKGSVLGAQVAVAAPGVDVMVPAPSGAYQLTTGTSVAAAHVSGVAALLLEKHPEADAQLILEVLTASATRLGTNKRDDKVGWGLIDPLAALSELDARLADTKVAGATPAASAKQAATPAAPTRAPNASASAQTPPQPRAAAPAAAATRSALPRPGIYVPKQ